MRNSVLGVVGHTVHTTAPGGFYQSPDNPFWQPGIQNAATSVDSFVTIGTHPNGNGNTSSGAVVPFAFANYTDEEGATDFGIIGQPVYSPASWSLPVANTQWGFPVAGRVLIGRFVVDHPTVCDRFGASLSVSWKPSTGGVATLLWEQSDIPSCWTWRVVPAATHAASRTRTTSDTAPMRRAARRSAA